MRLCALALLTMVVVAFAQAVPAATRPDGRPFLIAATGSPGGTYHQYGEGLATLLTRVLNLRIVAQATNGSGENIEMIEAGSAQLGFTTMGVALEAWNGSGNWTRGRQFREMRALFPMFDSPFDFLVLTNSDIRSLADMAGKRVGVGPQTGTSGTYVPKFLSTLSIDATFSYGTWNDIAEQLERGEIDVLAVSASPPLAAIFGLEAKRKIRHIAPAQAEIVTLRLAFPELSAVVLPPGTYPSLLAPYETVGLFSFVIADKDIPSDLAYDIVEAVFTHHDEMVEIHSAAAETVPENFVHNSFLPYHPGALRYYSNLGQAGLLERAIDFLQSLTVTIGNIHISPINVVAGLLWLALLLWLASRTARILEARVLSHSRLTPSVQVLFSRVMKVMLITAAVFIALGNMGIDLTAFAVFTGALGVGIGFGLQAIFNNFVAGLILLSEKSLKIGDFVDLGGGLSGTVRQINIRNTTITTPLNIDVVVPNSDFVNGRVTNWTMLDPHARIRVPFGVAYGTDCDLVREILLEAADEVEFTLKDDVNRKTQLWLVKFGENRLEFELVVWLTTEGIHRPLGAHAAYCWAIHTALRKHGIVVALPQRELYLKSAVPVEIGGSIALSTNDARPEPARSHSVEQRTTPDCIPREQKDNPPTP